MFRKTRLKLTLWYLLIIMIVSISFSGVIYLNSAREIDRVLRIQNYRYEHPNTRLFIIQRAPWESDDLPLPPNFDLPVLEQAKLRLIESLLGINLFILFFSALAGYFLAGRTLRPIKEMIDEQNRFITDASHELNTPITSLKTSIEVNLRNKNLTTELARKLLLSNLDDVNNLQNLSGNLIKLNQFQNVQQNTLFEKLIISDILEKSINRVKTQADKKQITINLKTIKAVVLGNEKSLTELFVILLDNAIKYSKNNQLIKINVTKFDSKIKINVKDQGLGIPDEDIEHIFDRFYRAEKSRTKNNYQGYGLGLSIAKRIVAIHNGKISVESKLNKGSEFMVILNCL